MKSMCGVQMLAGSIVTPPPSPSSATGEPWAAGDDVNGGAMTSWLLGISFASSGSSAPQDKGLAAAIGRWAYSNLVNGMSTDNVSTHVTAF